MGMTIDETLEYLKDFDSYSPYQEAINKVNTYIEQLQADYNARLKADMVATLTELQLEIEEIQSSQDCCDYAIDNCISRCDVADLIQQKIDKLKEQTGENI